MPKRDEAFMQKQRTRILDAAHVCFLNKGFRDTCIRDICSESGLSVGAVYTHFENRDAIVAAVSERITAQTVERTSIDSTVEEFLDFVCDLVISCLDNPRLTNLNHQLLADALSSDQMADVYKELMANSSGWIKHHLERFHREGDISMPFDFDTTELGLSALLTGFGLRLYFEPGASTHEVALQLRSLIGQLIGAPGSTPHVG